MVRIARKAAKFNRFKKLSTFAFVATTLATQNLSILKKKNRLSLAKKDGIYN
jgi:hypothetical protein